MVEHVNGTSGNNYEYSNSHSSQEPVKKKSKFGNIHDEYNKFRAEREKQYNEFKDNANDRYNKFADEVRINYEEFSNQAGSRFDSYKKAKNDEFDDYFSKKEQEFNDYINGKDGHVKKQKDTFFNGSSQTVRVEQGIQAKSTGLPIEEIPHLEVDENGNKVNNYYDSKGNLVKSEPYKSSSAVNSEVQDNGIPKENNQVKTPVTPESKPVNQTPEAKPVAPPPQQQEEEKIDIPEEAIRTVSSGPVKGKYAILPGKDGEGYTFVQNMRRQGYNQLLNYFTPGYKNCPVYYNEKTHMYKSRGYESFSQNSLANQLSMVADKMLIDHTVYKDLMAKKASGNELSQPEQLFVDHFMSSLEQYELKLDEKGEIVPQNPVE